MTLAKSKILIIDDEPDVIEFLSYNFSKQGYEVIGAENGAAGIEKIKSFHPNLIIADIMMPVMDGITMCRLIKSYDEYKQIPVILLSAVQDDYQVIKAGLTGIEEYISKPIVFSLLLRMVLKYLPVEKVSQFKDAEIES